MLLTEEFLNTQGACTEGIQFILDNNYIGQEYSSVIRSLVAADQKDFAGWMIDQKKTEAYVRANGKEFIMGSYQVFNPLAGTHAEYQTEEEAKVAVAEIGKEILNRFKITTCQSITNENGDSTWVAVDIVQNFDVTVN